MTNPETPQGLNELPLLLSLPSYLLDEIRDYGREQRMNETQRLRRLVMLHACIKAYATQYARAAIEAARQGAPIDMLLFCPACGMQHIDAAEPWMECGADGTSGCRVGPHGPDGALQCEFCGAAPRWTNPPHRSHLCHGCGHIWRPADVPTNGVAAIKTKGSADSDQAQQWALSQRHQKHLDGGLVAALRRQRQIDEDGAEVGVSREAVEVAAEILESLDAGATPTQGAQDNEREAFLLAASRNAQEVAASRGWALNAIARMERNDAAAMRKIASDELLGRRTAPHPRDQDATTAQDVVTVPERVAELVAQHGSLRAVARELNCDVGYLSRLASEEKDAPGSLLLERMGLRRHVTATYTRDQDSKEPKP